MRSGSHAATDEHWLPEIAQCLGQVGVTGSEGAGRALAMDEQFPVHAVDHMALFLAGVVRDVVEKIELGIGEYPGKDLAGEMADDLAVGQGAVDRRPHGAEITFSKRRVDPRAGEFAVRQDNSLPGCGGRHFGEELGTDLMAEAARAAMDGHDDAVGRQAETLGGDGIEYLGDFLDFQIVIA